MVSTYITLNNFSSNQKQEREFVFEFLTFDEVIFFYDRNSAITFSNKLSGPSVLFGNKYLLSGHKHLL